MKGRLRAPFSFSGEREEITEKPLHFAIYNGEMRRFPMGIEAD